MGSLKCNKSQSKLTSLLSSLCLHPRSNLALLSTLRLLSPRRSCLPPTLKWRMQPRLCPQHPPNQHTTSSNNQTNQHLTLSRRVATAHSSRASLTRLTAHSQSPTKRFPNSSTCRPVLYLILAPTRRLVATRPTKSSEYPSELPFRAFQHSVSQRILVALILTTHAPYTSRPIMSHSDCKHRYPTQSI